MIDLSKKYWTRSGDAVKDLQRNIDALTRGTYPFAGWVNGTFRSWTAAGKWRAADLETNGLDLVETTVAPAVNQYVTTDEFKPWQLGIIGVLGRLQGEVTKLTERLTTAVRDTAERVKTLTRHDGHITDLAKHAARANERLSYLDLVAREHNERLLKIEEQLKPKAALLPQRPGWVTPDYNLPEPGIKVLCQVCYQDTGLTYFSVLTYTGTSWETQGARRTGARSFRRPFTPHFVVRAWTYVEGLQ